MRCRSWWNYISRIRLSWTFTTTVRWRVCSQWVISSPYTSFLMLSQSYSIPMKLKYDCPSPSKLGSDEPLWKTASTNFLKIVRELGQSIKSFGDGMYLSPFKSGLGWSTRSSRYPPRTYRRDLASGFGCFSWCPSCWLVGWYAWIVPLYCILIYDQFCRNPISTGEARLGREIWSSITCDFGDRCHPVCWGSPCAQPCDCKYSKDG